MNFTARVLGIILLMTVRQVSTLQNIYTYDEVKKCGQTPCKPPGECCEDNKNCCCTSDPSGWSYNCISSEVHSWSMPWWGAVLIVVAVIAAVAAVVFLCYRRRKRQTVMFQSCVTDWPGRMERRTAGRTTQSRDAGDFSSDVTMVISRPTTMKEL